jgi:hypothetical protein
MIEALMLMEVNTAVRNFFRDDMLKLPRPVPPIVDTIGRYVGTV